MRVIFADVEAVATWAETNELKLNDAKTKVMVIDNRVHTSQALIESIPNISLCGTPLEFTFSVIKLIIAFPLEIKLDRPGVMNFHESIRISPIFALSSTRLQPRATEKTGGISSFFPYFDFTCAEFKDLNNTQTNYLEVFLKAYEICNR